MMKHIICLAMASAFASGSAWAESHRLAFSKSEKIEIFVEHAAGASWCSPQLDMRVVYLAEPNPGALATLMPKLGALLGQQCPMAAAVNWTSADAKGGAVAHGTSSKASGWSLAVAPANVVQATATADADTPAVAQEAPAPATVTQAAVEPPMAAGAAPVLAAAAPAVTPPAVTPPAIEAAASVAKTESEPVQEPAVAAAISAAAAPGPVVAPVAPGVPSPAPATAATVAAMPALPADFTVNGWKPHSDAEVRAQATFLTTMQDQNGCNVISLFNLGSSAQYLSLKSEGLTCASSGLAEGQGRLALVRSDGAVLARTPDLWFASGIPFTKEIIGARLAATNGKDTLWLHLGHDQPSQSYYLLRTNVGIYGGIGVWKIDPRIDAVTANEAVFRQADEIQGVVLAGLAALQSSAMPWASSTHLVFANDFENGVVKEQKDHLLYTIGASRQRDWRTGRGRGEWQIDLRRGTNYLFRRDEQLAQQKLREEEQQARLRRAKLIESANHEKRKLATYDSLMRDSIASPDKIPVDLQNDVDYRLIVGGGYNRLLGGAKVSITRIVRVKGSDGEDAKVDWPYEMRLVGQKSLKNQWYLIKGQVTLDGKRLDGDNLPLTLVKVNQEGVLPCAKDACADMANPLTVARLRFNDPQWTPEAARAVIEQADQP